MDTLFFVGRAMYAFIFLMSGVGHISQLEQMAQYPKAKRVPAPKLATASSGVLLVLGGLSVLLGVYTTLGLSLLVVFLVPATLIMHNFWAVKNPMERQMEMVNFLKNLALLGAALTLFAVQRWPLSLSG